MGPNTPSLTTAAFLNLNCSHIFEGSSSLSVTSFPTMHTDTRHQNTISNRGTSPDHIVAQWHHSAHQLISTGCPVQQSLLTDSYPSCRMTLRSLVPCLINLHRSWPTHCYNGQHQLLSSAQGRSTDSMLSWIEGYCSQSCLPAASSQALSLGTSASFSIQETSASVWLSHTLTHFLSASLLISGPIYDTTEVSSGCS